MRRIGALVAGILILNLPSHAVTASKVERIIEGIEKTYNALKGMEASFVQENRMANRSEPILARGRVFFKRPGMMRWDYETPKGQRIVSDGKTIWVYQPALKQVMVSPVTGEGEVLQDLLSGKVSLREDFQISLEGEDEGNYNLTLFPKKKKGIDMETIYLKVRKEDFMIVETVLKDTFGNITEVRFEKIKKDPSLSPDLFLFEIPEGVRVIK